MNGNESSRREWLRLCAAAGGSGMLLGGRLRAHELVPAATAVDHLLLGVSDLDAGIAWVEKATGLRAAVGGAHPGVGTRNALLALGGKRYLEIIAPDPAQSAYTFHIDVRKLSEPRLITWAAQTAAIDALAKKSRAVGFRTFGPRDGSRTRPDGRVLRWKTFGLMNDLGRDGVEPIPFFIQWAEDSRHPSQDSPDGCELRTFEIEHPDAARLKDQLAKVGIEARVRAADRARLVAVLRTPQGEVTLR